MGKYVKIKDQYYISASSSLADSRTLVLKEGDAFGVFDRYGDIHPIGQGAQGLYCEGTRFLSKMEMLIENERPLILSSSLREENEILTVDLTNPDIRSADNTLFEKGSLHIHRTKFIWQNVCYEKIRFSNFGIEPLTFNFTLSFKSDFSDIFEVRGIARKEKGKKFKTSENEDSIVLSYVGKDDVKRKTHVLFESLVPELDGKKANFTFCLLPKAFDELNIAIAMQVGDNMPEVLSYDEAHDRMLENLNTMKEDISEIYTSNEQFNEWLQRSKADLITMVTKTANGPYPYAGIPWYSTPFGRDGILTAWECLWMDPELTRGVLNYCAQTQAHEMNDFQDAEPGKIFHEKRGGEMANTGEIPFKLYYGTIDATPLFVSLAGAYLERTGDIDTIKNIWPNIKNALAWIDEYGDFDGDGFVEYAKKSEKGLINQGWKDSHDSIFYENGELAQGSIALCEVQGYVYDAKLKGADLADEFGEHELAEKLRSDAEKLKKKFAEVFWSKEKNTFVIALDGEKNKCNISSSNAGHCLFSGIVPDEYAEKLSNTLLNEKMFSGWGIRTVAKDESRYNPMSYHNGSIWPHDNALIAFGLARYGFKEEVKKVVSGMFDVTNYVEAERLPELFCGFEKRKNEGPTDYPVACSPQAWAVASVYLLIQSFTGINVVAKENIIYFYKPTLPDFLNEITIANLRVNDSKVVLQLRRNVNEIVVNVLHREGDVKIEIVQDYPLKQKPKVLENIYK